MTLLMIYENIYSVQIEEDDFLIAVKMVQIMLTVVWIMARDLIVNFQLKQHNVQQQQRHVW